MSERGGDDLKPMRTDNRVDCKLLVKPYQVITRSEVNKALLCSPFLP